MDNKIHLDISFLNRCTADTSTDIKCLSCNTMFKNKSSVADFIVNFQENQSVDTAFQAFFENEVIEEYKCIVCMEKVLATKKYTLLRTPECLTITLNRFSSIGAKFAENIEINKELIVTCIDEGEVHRWKFKLASVINHLGPHLHSGHYNTTVNYDNNIYTFDDSRVRKENESLSGRNAYILLYERMEELIVDDDPEEWTLIEIIDDDECMADASGNECAMRNVLESDSRNIENGLTIEDSDNHPVLDEELQEWIPVEIIDEDEINYLPEGENIENETLKNVMYVKETSNRVQNITSASDRNTDNSEETVGDEKKEESSRRIMDFHYVVGQMQKQFAIKCRNCCGDVSFTKETKRGLISKFHFTCSSCNQKNRIDSCPKNKNQANNNEAAVTGIVSIGLGYYHLQEFLAHFNTPCISYGTFHNVEKALQEDWWNLAKKLEADALTEEVRLAKENNEIDSAGNALITVKVDGSWGKRAYSGNFSSLCGCVAIIGTRTNKIFYSGIKNKYCHVCKIAENNGIPPHIHECNANYTGPPTGMENAIIVEGFKYCATKGARFHKFVGDGDSSTYKILRDLRLYQNPEVYIEKFDCRNHIHKNFTKKMIRLESNRKKNKQKLISSKLGDYISIGVTMAAKHWRESDISLEEKCTKLEKDCMNAPLHCLGVHDNCSEYFCTKTTTPVARDNVALLKNDGLYYEILSTCQHYFANKAKSLLFGFDNNVVEGFNSIIAKCLGGKRVNNALAGSYKLRTAIADVHLNSGYHSGSTFQEFKYGTILPSMLKMENTRKRKVDINTVRKENTEKKRKVDEDQVGNKNEGYGGRHQEVDQPPAKLEMLKTAFYERLNEDRLNRHSIQLETSGQRYSSRYCQLKQHLLTSTYFSRILHARSRKSYQKIVEDILYHNTIYSNTADQNHQRLHQMEALEIFSSFYNSESIDVCGIFIDEKISFLGASPFRLFGQDGIIVIKCPRKAFQIDFNVAIEKKLIPFWTKAKQSAAITVNFNSHWYMEIQGQLHVSAKKFAYFMVFLGPSSYKIERIERDDAFWKTKMEAELVFFFEEAMLKELVDSRDGRSMELRQYNEESKTFI